MARLMSLTSAWNNTYDITLIMAWAEFWYNSSYHSALQMSSYEVVYGVKPNLLPGYSPGEANVESVDELMQQRIAIQQHL